MREKTEAVGRRIDPLWLTVALILLAGVLHMTERLLLRYMMDHPGVFAAAYKWFPFAVTALFLLTNTIYVTLLIAWLRSVNRRLLPQRSRRYIAASVCFMLLLIALRMAKYRIFEDVPTAGRLSWYAYYVPLAFIPALFLMLGLEIKGGRRRVPPQLLLIPAALFSLLFLTNDLHHWAFSETVYVATSGFPGTYRYHALYYVFLVCAVVTAAAGFALLLKATVHQAGKHSAVLSLGIGLTSSVLFATEAIVRIYRNDVPLPFLFPEIAVFGIVGVMETCIRSRLIPYNENYVGFFSSLQLPARITDREFVTRFQTARCFSADERQMRRALKAPVALDEDNKLCGRALQAGCVFYVEDESALHRMNEKLEDANELLAEENTLIRAENDLKEQTERTRYRTQLYAQIAETLYPRQREISDLLDLAEPGQPSFRAIMAQVAVRNAFIKRGTNLLLLQEEHKGAAAEALTAAMEESAKYFAYAGLLVSVADLRKKAAANQNAFLLYESFEIICETVIPFAGRIHTALNDGGLRLVADCAAPPPLPQTPLPVSVQQSEGLCYFTVLAGGERT